MGKLDAMCPTETAAPYLELPEPRSASERARGRLAIFGSLVIVIGAALGVGLFLGLRESGAGAAPPSVCMAYCLSHGGALNSPSAAHGSPGVKSAADGGGTLQINLSRGHHGGRLPLTGAEIAAIVIVALVLVGVGVLVVHRSRRLTDSTAYR